MLKMKLILMAIKIAMTLTALGIGIWYLSSSLDGDALTYSSMDNFMTAVGAKDGDITDVAGCFMCGYVSELFAVIGNAAEIFWTKMVDNIWILLAIGFGIFLFIYTTQYIWDATKTTAKLDDKPKSIEFGPWFDKVWRQGARVMIVGALIGALGMGGTVALRTMTNITITPVMYLGAELSMAATGVTDSTQCHITTENTDDILNPIVGPFMCVVGNLNSVMLAGAAGGFALMNYAWMGMGGGLFTWIAGLGMVIMFLVVGFHLFFQILSVIFKLIFLIIFMPLIIAAYAFEGTWALAAGVVKNSVTMLVQSAIQIIAITLKILIVFATVSYAADEFFPGPLDGYSAILPPMMGLTPENPDAQTMSVMNVFSTCERVALVDGEMDGDKFKDCFTAQKAAVERQYPGAFDFLGDGWDFMLMMIGLFLIYFYVVNPKIDNLLGKFYDVTGGLKGEKFDFGNWTLNLGKKIWHAPAGIFKSVSEKLGKKD